MRAKRLNSLIALGLLCFAVLGCGTAIRGVRDMAKDPAPTPIKSAADCIPVLDSELVHATQNGNRAPFLGKKWLEVSGRITLVTSDMLVMGGNIGDGTKIGFDFQPDRKGDISAITAGQNVTVRAQCCATMNKENGISLVFAQVVPYSGRSYARK